MLLIDGYEVVEQQCVGTFLTVLGQHAYKQAVDHLRLVEPQGAQYVPPPEGPQSAVAALLQRLGQRRQGDAHAHDGVVVKGVVLDERDHGQVEHLEVHLDILVNLCLRHLAVAIQVTEGFVDDVEHLLSVLCGSEDVLLGEFLDLQVVAFHHHLRYLHELLGHAFLRHIELVLHVVVVLFVTLHLFHQLGVVGEVILRSHAAELLESACEHALGVHVGESQRTDDLLHAVAATKVLDGSEQCAQHVDVVNKVKPPEAHCRAVPLFVVAVVDDGSHASHHLVVAVG